MTRHVFASTSALALLSIALLTGCQSMNKDAKQSTSAVNNLRDALQENLDRKSQAGVAAEMNAIQLIEPVVTQQLAGTIYQAVVTHADGRILYHADPAQVGKNINSDPLYAPFKDLKKALEQITAQPEGVASYRFYRAGTKKIVRKNIRWSSVHYQGSPWRVGIIWE